MPVIPNLILSNQLPINTYSASLVASASMVNGYPCVVVADGLGNQITLMDLTASYAFSASVQETYELSSSFASQSMWSTSASFASRSLSSSYSSASFIQYGNSFGDSASLGTNDNFRLALKANTSESLFINPNGRVSIGTGSAERTLHVVGTGVISERTNGSPQLVLRRGNDWGFSIGANGAIQLVDVANASSAPFAIQSASLDGLFTIRDTRILVVGGTISASQVTASLFNGVTFTGNSATATTASWAATASKFSPSQGVVTNAGPLTGSVSASGFGFTTDVEFNTFVTSISSSMIEFNSLLAKLRTAGIIT